MRRHTRMPAPVRHRTAMDRSVRRPAIAGPRCVQPGTRARSRLFAPPFPTSRSRSRTDGVSNPPAFRATPRESPVRGQPARQLHVYSRAHYLIPVSSVAARDRSPANGRPSSASCLTPPCNSANPASSTPASQPAQGLDLTSVASRHDQFRSAVIHRKPLRTLPAALHWENKTLA